MQFLDYFKIKGCYNTSNFMKREVNYFLYIHLKKFNECKMQFMNNGFNTFKMNDSTYVQMLIIQEL